MKNRVYGLFPMTLLLSTSANATTVAVAEPGIMSLLGLGAVAAVLSVRLFRK